VRGDEDALRASMAAGMKGADMPVAMLARSGFSSPSTARPVRTSNSVRQAILRTARGHRRRTLPWPMLMPIERWTD